VINSRKKIIQDRLDVVMTILDDYIDLHDDIVDEERKDNERIKETFKTYSPEELGGDCS